MFEAVTVHRDDIEQLPPGAVVLASSDMGVQAVELRHARGRFWGVQYHPEYSYTEIAATALRYAEVLLREQLVRGPSRAGGFRRGSEGAAGATAGALPGLEAWPGAGDAGSAAQARRAAQLARAAWSCPGFSAAIEADMPDAQFALIALAGFAAGAVNALAGGGTLISFPALVAAGFPAVAANSPAPSPCVRDISAPLTRSARELRGQRARLYMLLPVSVARRAARRRTAAAYRRAQVHPGRALAAAAAPARCWRCRSACAARCAARVTARPAQSRRARRHRCGCCRWSAVAAIYGGFFGAGMSVILLAVLGLALADPLPRLNALKQATGARHKLRGGALARSCGRP